MPNTSYIRLLHASPNAPAVDVYANQASLTEDLSYGEFTPYLPILPGDYTIEIFPTMNSESPVLMKEIMIPENIIATVAVIGELPNIELYIIEDPKEMLKPRSTGLRLIHLSPNAPALDVLLADESILFEDVAYKEVTDYIQLGSKTYAIQLIPTGTDEPILFVPNIRLLPDRFYSIYAVGLAGENPPVQVLIPLDGGSYIDV